MCGLRARMRKRPRLMAFVFGMGVAVVLFVIALLVIIPFLLPSRDAPKDLRYEGTITTAEGEKVEFVLDEGASPVPEPERVRQPLSPPAEQPEKKPELPAPEAVTPRAPDGPRPDETPTHKSPRLEKKEEPKALEAAPVPGLLRIPKKNEDPRPRAGKPLRFYIYDPDLGYLPRPNVKVSIRKKRWKTNEVLFDAVYSTDKYSRRITVPQNKADQALIFLGCSYTFGWGVNDDETLPSQLAALMPEFSVLNYGFNGAGAQHILEILRSKKIHTHGLPEKAAVIYPFLHVHIRRAIGVYDISKSKSFGKYFPWYELEGDKPVRKGNFSDRRRRWNWNQAYRRKHGIKNWYGEYIIKEDALLVCRLLEHGKRLFESHFDSLGFFILIFPERQGAYTDYVVDHCRKKGFEVLDYRGFFGKDYVEDDHFIPHDGHPLPSTCQKIAQRLRNDVRSRMDRKKARNQE